MLVNVPFADRSAESNLYRAIRVSKHLGGMAITPWSQSLYLRLFLLIVLATDIVLTLNFFPAAMD